MKIQPNDLYRIKNDTWIFPMTKKEVCRQEDLDDEDCELCKHLSDEIDVRLITDNYRIALIAANLIKNKAEKKENILGTPINFTLKHHGCIDGDWQVKVITDHSTLFKQFWQSIPFTRKLEDRAHIRFEITKQEGSHWSTLTKLFKEQVYDYNPSLIVENEYSCIPRSFEYNPQISFSKRLEIPPFKDAFTVIATESIQKWEKNMFPNPDFEGSYRIVMRNNQLELERYVSSEQSLLEIEENRLTIKAYQDFLIQEYGIETVNYLQYQYKINFQEMLRHGSPLFGDHIYRINMGVSAIEAQGAGQLFDNLKLLLKHIENLDNTHILATELFDPQSVGRTTSYLCYREIKSLFAAIRNHYELPTITDIQAMHVKQYLSDVLQINNYDVYTSLPEANFNALIDIIDTSHDHIESMYTGKKLIHKAIMGYYLMENPQYFQPWVDVQGLLQIHQDLRKQNDWENYYELLTHVVAKKHLVREHPIDKWRVGALIPAPDDQRGHRRWYRVESCLDDGFGDFNYTLVKACDNYQGLPALKLYRSTAMSPYAMSGEKSVDADLQIARGPGAANREAADEHEIPFFHERTIPVWVGYYLKAAELSKSPLIQTGSEQEQVAILQQVVRDYIKAIRNMETDLKIPKDERLELEIQASRANITQLQKQLEKYEKILKEKAIELKELPEFKQAEDITFLGHSLGGALAQGGLFHFGPHMNRIPLPGKNFICYFSDSPAIPKSDVDEFYEFGQEHQNLLKYLNQKWQLIGQFEYGDPVPEAGEVHLSANQLSENRYEQWLSIKNSIFRPKSTATCLTIITTPTHGRRIGLADEGKDYSLKNLSPRELYEYNTSWWLGPHLQKLFGYRFVNSPVISEQIRRVAALIHTPFKTITRIFSNDEMKLRAQTLDGNLKYFFVPFRPTKHKLVTVN